MKFHSTPIRSPGQLRSTTPVNVNKVLPVQELNRRFVRDRKDGPLSTVDFIHRHRRWTAKKVRCFAQIEPDRVSGWIFFIFFII